MVQSFYGSNLLVKGYILNNFNHYKFDEDKILVTTEHGSWVLLSGEEFKLLRIYKVEEDPNLFSVLEEKGIIFTEDNVKRVINDYKERNHFLFQGPTLHIVVPTLRCNQRCIYCHSRAQPSASKGFDMDEETAKATVDFIFQAPVKSLVIEFQGGDCLLNYEITEFIIDHAKKIAKEKNKKVGFSLVTNLTLMNEDIIKSLKERKIMGLSTSLDGPKEVHDKNRKFLDGRGSYDEVIHWVERIKNEWKFNFNLNALCTVSKYSLDYGKEIVNDYIKHKFHGVWLRPLNNIGFAEKAWEKVGYTPEEYLEFWKNTLDYIIRKNQKGKYFVELMALIFLRKILHKKDPMVVDIQSPCGAAIGQLLYKYNGDIHTCDEGKIFEEFKLGNVKISKYSDIFKNNIVSTLIDISSKKNYLCDNCVWNPYCGICPIYTYGAQGNIVSKLAMDDKCKVYSEITKTIFKKLLFSETDKKIFFDWYKKDVVFGR